MWHAHAFCLQESSSGCPGRYARTKLKDSRMTILASMFHNVRRKQLMGADGSILSARSKRDHALHSIRILLEPIGLDDFPGGFQQTSLSRAMVDGESLVAIELIDISILLDKSDEMVVDVGICLRRRRLPALRTALGDLVKLCGIRQHGTDFLRTLPIGVC